MMLRPTLLLLLLVLMLTPEGCGGWWRRQRVRVTTPAQNINICRCNTVIADFIKLLRDVLTAKGLGKREVSAVFDVDEDDPLLEEFMQTSMDKRDGLVDREKLLATVERAAQAPQKRNSNHCVCGRMLLEEATRSSHSNSN